MIRLCRKSYVGNQTLLFCNNRELLCTWRWDGESVQPPACPQFNLKESSCCSAFALLSIMLKDRLNQASAADTLIKNPFKLAGFGLYLTSYLSPHFGFFVPCLRCPLPWPLASAAKDLKPVSCSSSRPCSIFTISLCRLILRWFICCSSVWQG